MEQDIKDIELFIDFCRAPYNFEQESEEKSYKELSYKIEHLIKAYKELEEKNKKKSIEIICYQEELENSIPVSLVEETIEELGNMTLLTVAQRQEVSYAIAVLQELLQEGDDK